VRILLVEDDSALADAVCSYLLAKAFVVDVASSLAEARGVLAPDDDERRQCEPSQRHQILQRVAGIGVR